MESLERRDTPSVVVSTPDHAHAASPAVMRLARIGPIIDTAQVVASAQVAPGGLAQAKIIVPVILD
jgi:hypothetical protein